MSSGSRVDGALEPRDRGLGIARGVQARGVGDEQVGVAPGALLGDSRGSKEPEGDEGHDEVTQWRPWRDGQRPMERRSHDEPHDEPSDVSRVVDAGDERAEEQVEAHEEHEAPAQLAQEVGREVDVSEIQKCSERSRDAEYGPGGPGTRDVGVPREARETTPEPARDVDQKERSVAEHALGEHAEAPETPHIEEEVQQTDVDEGRAENAPPLAAERERAEVGAVALELQDVRTRRRHAEKHHDDEPADVQREERRGDVEARRGFEQ